MRFKTWLLLERNYDERGSHWQVYEKGAFVFEGTLEECRAYVETHRTKGQHKPVERPMARRR